MSEPQIVNSSQQLRTSNANTSSAPDAVDSDARIARVEGAPCPECEFPGPHQWVGFDSEGTPWVECGNNTHLYPLKRKRWAVCGATWSDSDPDPEDADESVARLLSLIGLSDRIKVDRAEGGAA